MPMSSSPPQVGPWISAALLALGLGGCSLVPPYQRPSVDLAPYSTGGRQDAPVDPVWWRAFGSPELDALEAKAAGGNFDVQAAVARIEQARASAAIAGGPLLPQIDLGGTLDRQTGLSKKNTQQIAFQAGYEIDFWGKNRAAADSAKTGAAATAHDAATVAVTLAASVANTYFQILSLQERIQQAQEIARAAERILALMEQQNAAGTASVLQVEQQRAAVAIFQANVPALQQQLEQNGHLLATLLGERTGQTQIAGHALHSLHLPEPESGIPSALLQRRPDIRAAEARLIAANFDVGAAKAALLPSVTFNASLGLTAKSLGQFFPATLLTDLAAGLAQPIFDNGRLQGRVDYDTAHVQELIAAYRQTALVAFQDVEDALSAKRQLQALAAANLAAVDAARKAQSLAEEQYRLGGADYLTVLNTQRTLSQAEDALLQTRLQQLQAAVSLFRALGGGFPLPTE